MLVDVSSASSTFRRLLVETPSLTPSLCPTPWLDAHRSLTSRCQSEPPGPFPSFSNSPPYTPGRAGRTFEASTPPHSLGPTSQAERCQPAGSQNPSCSRSTLVFRLSLNNQPDQPNQPPLTTPPPPSSLLSTCLLKGELQSLCLLSRDPKTSEGGEAALQELRPHQCLVHLENRMVI